MKALPLLLEIFGSLCVYFQLVCYHISCLRSLLLAHLRVEYSDSIEQPIGDHKEQHQHGEQRPEHKDPREAGPRRPEEERPDGQQQYEQLEGHGDEEALTGRAAALQLLRPEQVGEHQEGQRRQEHEQAQDHGQGQGEVAAAVEPHAVLEVLGDANDVLLREAVLGCASDGRGGLAPVVILGNEKKTKGFKRTGFCAGSTDLCTKNTE